MKDFQGKVAVVTGAASGIGRAGRKERGIGDEGRAGRCRGECPQAG